MSIFSEQTLKYVYTVKTPVSVGIFFGDEIVDHSDVVGTLPNSAAPTTSSFST